MKLYINGHSDRYAMEQLQLCLFPEEPMEFCEEPFQGDGAVSKLRYCGGGSSSGPTIWQRCPSFPRRPPGGPSPGSGPPSCPPVTCWRGERRRAPTG